MLLILLRLPMTTIALLLIAHFYFKKKHGLGLIDVKGLSKIYFTQPWHERVSIVDGMKEPSKVTC